MEQTVMNVREAAGFTRLSTATVYSYVAQRRMPFLKVGAKLLFKKSDLEEWLDRHRVPVSGE